MIVERAFCESESATPAPKSVTDPSTKTTDAEKQTPKLAGVYRDACATACLHFLIAHWLWCTRKLKRRTGDASFEDFQHTLHKDNFFNNVVVAPITKTNLVRFSQESDRGETDNEVSTRESFSSELYSEDVKRKKQLLHIGQQ